MKISAYHKSIGNDVILKMDYEDLNVFDKVYISKVFVQTEIPGEPKDKSGKNESTVIEWYKDNQFLKQPNIEYGGTGFFYDKAPKLPSEIEHQKPDYHLYDEWVNSKLSEVNEKTGKPKYKRVDFKYYLDSKIFNVWSSYRYVYFIWHFIYYSLYSCANDWQWRIYI